MDPLKVLVVIPLLVIITLLFLTGINDDVLEKVQRLQFSEIANLVPGTESLSLAITAKKQIKIPTMNMWIILKINRLQVRVAGAHVLNGIERTGVSSRDWSQLKDILKFVGVEIHYSTPLHPLLLNSIGPRSYHGLSISATV